MREISTPELSALVNELGWLADFYIDKFYEISGGRFRIRMSRRGRRQTSSAL